MPAPSAEATGAKPRLASLDAMRGLVIALMLLVNMTWDRDTLHTQLFHVPWNAPAQGATVTDLVFPWFVFIMGASAPLSMASGRARGLSSVALMQKAFVRGAKLYLWGVLLTVASYAHQRPVTWDCLLSWNILQLLGAAYVVTAAVWLLPMAGRVAFVVLALLAKWATLLIPYDIVTQSVQPRPIEGAPTGPGTWAHFDAIKQLFHMEFVPVANWSSQLVGWFGMAVQYVPLAAIAVVAGLLAERLMKAPTKDTQARLRTAGRTALAGLTLWAIAVLLQWDYQPEGGGLWGLATAPYSKWFFTPAYCLLAAGTGAVLLAACYLLVDVTHAYRFPLLQSMGKNALAVYVGAELSFKLIFSKWLLPSPNGEPDTIAAAIQAWTLHATGVPLIASLSWAVVWVALWLAIARWLDRRRTYWRV